MVELSKLQDHLRDLAAKALPGDRLPPVRDLMRDFSLSQPNVQRVLADLKHEGVISAQIGRGTFFVKGGDGSVELPVEKPPLVKQRGRSVMLLRRVLSTGRARFVADDVQNRILQSGDLALEVAYSDADHAKQVLQGMPRFDACLVQNFFEKLPIDMLTAIRKKTDTVVVDGAWLMGTDVDAVGFEWGEPVARAIDLLVQQGHRRIGYITTASSFLANELGKLRYRRLRQRPEFADRLLEIVELSKLPHADYEQLVVEQIRAAKDQHKMTAVLVWGVENGAVLRSLLERHLGTIPARMSVVLLGRTDLVAEHADFFTMIGYSSAEQGAALHAKLLHRWANPSAPYVPEFVPMHERSGQTVAPMNGWRTDTG
ncbi:GntR family transcriptional regulator [Lacibacterium aquatile]|uniref:GntR family transcriptional regulator n=1 Tax=Lacibacterium aquatile TaxID=1168082 RepID=A0ABW5DVZ3_9PROT